MSYNKNKKRIYLSSWSFYAENKKRYHRDPTLEEVEMFVKQCGIGDAPLERYLGLATSTIRHCRNGRRWPIKYRHLIFENIVINNIEPDQTFEEDMTEVKKTFEGRSTDDYIQHARLLALKKV